MEASSTTITCRLVSPPASLRSARRWVSDELGMPVPASRSAAVRAATAVPMTRKPACSQPMRAVREQGGLARAGLADDQVVAVARGEQLAGPRPPVLRPGEGDVVGPGRRGLGRTCAVRSPIRSCAEPMIRCSAASSSVVV